MTPATTPSKSCALYGSIFNNNVFLGTAFGTITVKGGAGINSLFVNDSTRTLFTTYTLTTSPSPRIYLGDAVNPLLNVVYTSINSFLRLDTASGSDNSNDTINIDGTAGGSPITINSGKGNDSIAVTAAGNVLTVDAGVGTDSLTLHNYNTYDENYTLTSTSVARDFAPITTYGAVETLTVNAGTGTNWITVVSTAAGTATTVNANVGNDTINVGAPGLYTFGALTVNGQVGSDTLNVNDQANPTDQTYTVTNTTVSRTGGGVLPVTYGTFDNLLLNVGSGNEQISVDSTAAGTATTVNGNIGDDNVFVTYPSGNLGNLGGPLTVNGQAGTDALTFWDDFNTANDSFTITAATVSRAAAQTATYTTVENLTVHAGIGNNQIYVNSTISGTTTQVNAGSGNDHVHLTQSSEKLVNLAGPLTVNGQDGDDDLSARDDLSGGGVNTYTITAGLITRTGGVSNITYSSFEHAQIQSGNGADTFNVTNNEGNLEGIPGLTIVSRLGSDRLRISDHSYPHGDTYFVTSLASGPHYAPYYTGTMHLPSIGLAIGFLGIETLDLYPSPHPNTVVDTSGYDPAHFALNIIMTPPPFGPGTAPGGVGGSGGGHRPAKPLDRQASWPGLTVDDGGLLNLQGSPKGAATWAGRAAIGPPPIADELLGDPFQKTYPSAANFDHVSGLVT